MVVNDNVKITVNRSWRSHPFWGWRIGLFTFCLSFLPISLQAGEVTLSWDPPLIEFGGFILSYGNETQIYTFNEDVGKNTSFTLTDLEPGRMYYFAVKAYNPGRDMESPYSNEVSTTVSESISTPPAPPQDVRIISN